MEIQNLDLKEITETEINKKKEELKKLRGEKATEAFNKWREDFRCDIVPEHEVLIDGQKIALMILVKD